MSSVGGCSDGSGVSSGAPNAGAKPVIDLSSLLHVSQQKDRNPKPPSSDGIRTPQSGGGGSRRPSIIGSKRPSINVVPDSSRRPSALLPPNDSRRPSALGAFPSYPPTPSLDGRGRGSSSATDAATASKELAPEPLSPSGISAFSGMSGWAPLAYKAASEPRSNVEPLPVLLEDKKILAELSNSMVSQLNSMFAFMTQVLVKEKNNHSSNISLMMRKVDKDLKDTYGAIKGIFADLTGQLTSLVKEVERSRMQVRNIQEKYTTLRENMEAQAQYIVELEAVLDGQCSGVSETMRKLNDRAMGRARELKKAGEDNSKREAALKKENRALREQLRHVQDVEQFTHTVPPALPEMTASWTRRASSVASEEQSWGSPGARQASRGTEMASPPMSPDIDGVDVVGSVMSFCDSSRSVPRSKPVRMPPLSPPHSSRGRRPFGGLPQSPRSPGAGLRRRGSGSVLQEPEMAELRQRAQHAEERCERLLGMVSFASTSLLLLRDVFGELRASRYLVATAEGKQAATDYAEKQSSSLVDAEPPDEVLGRLVRMFHAHVPKLGGLQEVISALGQEVAAEPWNRDGFLEDSSTSTVLK